MKDITIFSGWLIVDKKKKRFTLKDLDTILETGCSFHKKPTKKQLKELLFDPKTEKVVRVTFTLVDKKKKKKTTKRNPERTDNAS